MTLRGRDGASIANPQASCTARPGAPLIPFVLLRPELPLDCLQANEWKRG